VPIGGDEPVPREDGFDTEGADRVAAVIGVNGRRVAAATIPAIPYVASINLEFAAGTIAHIELPWLAPSKRRPRTAVEFAANRVGSFLRKRTWNA
jgi:hypothetical protein